MKIALLTALVLAASVTQAATAISCGSGSPREESPFFSSPEIQVSSEDDVYRGAVGGTWDLKLKDQADWMKATPQVKASMVKSPGGETIVTITLLRNDGLSPTGIKYVLTGLYSESPKLEKFAVGGFAGGSKTGEFSCVGVID